MKTVTTLFIAIAICIGSSVYSQNQNWFYDSVPDFNGTINSVTSWSDKLILTGTQTHTVEQNATLWHLNQNGVDYQNSPRIHTTRGEVYKKGSFLYYITATKTKIVINKLNVTNGNHQSKTLHELNEEDYLNPDLPPLKIHFSDNRLSYSGYSGNEIKRFELDNFAKDVQWSDNYPANFSPDIYAGNDDELALFHMTGQVPTVYFYRQNGYPMDTLQNAPLANFHKAINVIDSVYLYAETTNSNSTKLHMINHDSVLNTFTIAGTITELTKKDSTSAYLAGHFELNNDSTQVVKLDLTSGVFQDLNIETDGEITTINSLDSTIEYLGDFTMWNGNAAESPILTDLATTTIKSLPPWSGEFSLLKHFTVFGSDTFLIGQNLEKLGDPVANNLLYNIYDNTLSNYSYDVSDIEQKYVDGDTLFGRVRFPGGGQYYVSMNLNTGNRDTLFTWLTTGNLAKYDRLKERIYIYGATNIAGGNSAWISYDLNTMDTTIFNVGPTLDVPGLAFNGSSIFVATKEEGPMFGTQAHILKYDRNSLTLTDTVGRVQTQETSSLTQITSFKMEAHPIEDDLFVAFTEEGSHQHAVGSVYNVKPILDTTFLIGTTRFFNHDNEEGIFTHLEVKNGNISLTGDISSFTDFNNDHYNLLNGLIYIERYGNQVLFEDNNTSTSMIDHFGGDFKTSESLVTYAFSFGGNNVGTYIDRPLRSGRSFMVVKRSAYVIQPGFDESNQNSNEFLPYPNPAKNSFSIENANKAKRVNVFNINGSLIFESSKAQNISCSSWDPGTYIIEVTSRKGKHSSHKLIVE